MQRTQIYLSQEEHRALERVSKRTGRSKSQLIREAVDETYLGGRSDPDEALRVLARTAGSWRRRDESGARYVDRVRGGRLARLHKR